MGLYNYLTSKLKPKNFEGGNRFNLMDIWDVNIKFDPSFKYSEDDTVFYSAGIFVKNSEMSGYVAGTLPTDETYWDRYTSKNQFTDALKTKLDNIVNSFLGIYANGTALATAHPSPSPGSWANVTGTGTVWFWDNDDELWEDSGSSAPNVVVEDRLDSTSTNNALSANQGKVIWDYVSALVLDEDNFASDSPTKAPSQQSVAAYIATQLSNYILSSEKTDTIAEDSTQLVEGGAIFSALATKVDKVEGKGLSTNDFSNDYKQTLEELAINNGVILPEVGLSPIHTSLQAIQTFDSFWKQNLSAVLFEDLLFALAESGNSPNRYIVYVINPNGYTPEFPSEWTIYGDAWNVSKMMRLMLYYDGERVEVVKKQLNEDAPDVLAPVLSGAGVSSITDTAANFDITTNEDDTTVYWALYPTADSQHTKGEILAGTGSVDFGSVTGNTGALQSAMDSMTAETAYKVHYYGEDNNGNETGLFMSESFTTSTAATPIVWANISSNLTVNGSIISKVSNNNSWGDTAESNASYNAPFAVGASIYAPNKKVMFGICQSQNPTDYTDFKIAVFLRDTGNLEQIYVDGVPDGSVPIDSYSAGDAIEIEVDADNDAHIKIRGQIVHTVENIPDVSYYLATDHNETGGGFENAEISS